MLPLATTTGSILALDDGDPYEAADSSVIETGIAAHLSSPSGSEADRGGQLERIDAVLLADTARDLEHTHLWRDDPSGRIYRVAWVERRRGLGLDHIKAGLTRYSGGATGG